MARTGAVVGDAAAHVEQMAQGPVPEQNVIFFPPPGTGEQGPPTEPPNPYLWIGLATPAPGAVSGSASAGVVLTARGNVDFNKYTIEQVAVRFPGSGFVQAALAPLDGWSFTATSKPIKTPGPGSVTARVTARKITHTAEVVTESVSVAVNIQLSDDIPPNVQITSPAANAVLTPRPDGMYQVPLEVKVTDNTAQPPAWSTTPSTPAGSRSRCPPAVSGARSPRPWCLTSGSATPLRSGRPTWHPARICPLSRPCRCAPVTWSSRR